MDTSGTYIKMCKKAAEIQGLRVVGKDYDNGDCYARFVKSARRKYNRWYINWSGDNSDGEYGLPDRGQDEVWLPRQDQLQKMVPDVGTWTDHNRALAKCFANFCNKEIIITDSTLTHYKEANKAKKQEIEGRYSKAQEEQEYPHQFASMEQLWLAFVMKETFGKTWNGENWI